jgi:hypothetical protein
VACVVDSHVHLIWDLGIILFNHILVCGHVSVLTKSRAKLALGLILRLNAAFLVGALVVNV